MPFFFDRLLPLSFDSSTFFSLSLPSLLSYLRTPSHEFSPRWLWLTTLPETEVPSHPLFPSELTPDKYSSSTFSEMTLSAEFSAPSNLFFLLKNELIDGVLLWSLISSNLLADTCKVTIAGYLKSLRYFHQAKYLVWRLWFWLLVSSKFKLNIERYATLHRFCFTSICDWSRKLVPLSQPITYHACVFPRFFEFSLALKSKMSR